MLGGELRGKKGISKNIYNKRIVVITFSFNFKWMKTWMPKKLTEIKCFKGTESGESAV